MALSVENLDTVTNNGAGQDSADYNGPDGGQDLTQYGFGPDTIEFRAFTSASAFFSWAAQIPNSGNDVSSILTMAPSDTAAAQAVTNYIYTHNGGAAGFDPGYLGDIIIHGYHSTFGSVPTLDLYSVWFNSGLSASGSGDNHQQGTRVGDFTLVGAQGNDIAQFQKALDYLHRSPQAAALLEWAAVHHVEIRFNHTGRDFGNQVGNYIDWDPTSGLDLGNGHLQSPALGLIHEIGHVFGDIRGAPTILFPPGDPNVAYFSQQEFNDIVNIETPVAIELGESVRFSDGAPQHAIPVVDVLYHF